MKKAKESDIFKKIKQKIDSPKFKKYGIPTIVVFSVALVTLILFGGLDGLMGNSVYDEDYTCEGVWGPSEYEVVDEQKGNKCYRTYNIASRLLGDVNNDNTVTVDDVVLIQEHLAALRDLDAFQLKVADSDENGTVNIKDANKIQLYAKTVGGVTTSSESSFNNDQKCVAEIAKKYDTDADNFYETPAAKEYEKEIEEKCKVVNQSISTTGSTSTVTQSINSDENIGTKRVCPNNDGTTTYKLSKDKMSCSVTLVRDAIRVSKIDVSSTSGSTSGWNESTVGWYGSTSGWYGGTTGSLRKASVASGVTIEEKSIPDSTKVYDQEDELEFNLTLKRYGNLAKLYWYRIETYYNVNSSYPDGTRNYISKCNPVPFSDKEIEDELDRQIKINMYVNNRRVSLKVFDNKYCASSYSGQMVAEYKSDVYKTTANNISVARKEEVYDVDKNLQVKIESPKDTTLDKEGNYLFNFNYFVKGSKNYWAKYYLYENGKPTAENKCYLITVKTINRIQRINVNKNPKYRKVEIYKDENCSPNKKIKEIKTDSYISK